MARPTASPVPCRWLADFSLWRRPPAKDAKGSIDTLFVSVEEPVAPVDRGAQRLLARIGGMAFFQQVEPFPEALEQLFGTQQTRARHGKLDRKGQTVELGRRPRPESDLGEPIGGGVLSKGRASSRARGTKGSWVASPSDRYQGDAEDHDR